MHTHFSERPSFVRSFELVETGTLRRRMQAAVDALIEALDALDGDADLEPANDDEPSLGWPGVGHGAAGRLDGPAYDSGDDDREFDDADDEDGGDAESDIAELGVADLDALADPSLGFGCRDLGFNGSGRAIAVASLQHRGIVR
ncbi:MAG TPA: hypothetical protein VNX29_16075 [Kaistia sp.]|nr:hypothetical protein [Kaistia sp.]